MTPDTIAALAGIGMALAGGYGHLLYRLGRQDLKVDTMWAAHLRRGEAELVRKGWGKRSSPITVLPHAASLFPRQLALDLQEAYRAQGWAKLSRGGLALAIEGAFGERILDEVCIPEGFESLGCLLVAAAIAAGEISAPAAA